MDGDLVFRRVLDRGGDVGGRAGEDHAERPDLIEAGVAGVKLQEDVIAADVAGD
jgi:hypothetical protein